MNLRCGKVKDERLPVKKNRQFYAQYKQHFVFNEFERNVVIHDRTLNGFEDKDTSTAKNKSNKSNKDGSSSDEDVDENHEIEIPEDIIGSPLDLINSTKRNKQGEFCKKLCYAGHYYVVDRDYVKTKNIKKVDWKCERIRTTQTNAKCIGRVTSKALTTKDQPRSLIRSASLDLDNAIASLITENKALLSTIKRVRKDKAGYGQYPKSLEEIDVIPLVYSLLHKKDLLTYKKLYSMLMPYVKNKPKSINIDFELANITAIRHCFRETKIYGCFFHFTQNMWKHVQAEKKTDEYVLWKDHYYLFRALQSLAFVPLEHVTLKYFETYYLGVKLNAFHPDSHPNFGIVEAWHKQFEGCCGKNPGGRANVIRIYHMCTTFDKDDIKGFLSGMAQNLCE
ncbi:general transcription factor II-I-like [Brachionus plicatilis]|uniref:General transcription factor II-I-like n=1 Tax=Brachionus plicatilis TaxID=10195 RepID=A0A3M7S8U3_BRAPC|nr:general transcription factor II-I-like [Brachionus plicatilis]